jgi:hypothetical protein
MMLSKALQMQQDLEDKKNEIIIEGLENKIKEYKASLEKKVSGTIIRGTPKTPKSQLVTPISTKLQRPDGCD